MNISDTRTAVIPHRGRGQASLSLTAERHADQRQVCAVYVLLTKGGHLVDTFPEHCFRDRLRLADLSSAKASSLHIATLYLCNRIFALSWETTK